MQNLEILQLDEMYIGMDSYLLKWNQRLALLQELFHDTNITQFKQKTAFWWT